MPQSDFAKLFMNGRSQAVRLPRQYRLPGTQVRVRRTDTGVLLEPVLDPSAWFEEMDAAATGEFMPDGRQQPTAPPRDALD